MDNQQEGYQEIDNQYIESNNKDCNVLCCCPNNNKSENCSIVCCCPDPGRGHDCDMCGCKFKCTGLYCCSCTTSCFGCMCCKMG